MSCSFFHYRNIMQMQTAPGCVWEQNFNSMGLNGKYKNIVAASNQLPEWVSSVHRAFLVSKDNNQTPARHPRNKTDLPALPLKFRKKSVFIHHRGRCLPAAAREASPLHITAIKSSSNYIWSCANRSQMKPFIDCNGLWSCLKISPAYAVLTLETKSIPV